MRLFVVDPHPIYRGGLVASLQAIAGVVGVAEAASPKDAWSRREALCDADIVVLDCAADGGIEFIRELRDEALAAVLVCSDDTRDPTVRAALGEGANGYVAKGQLTHETLEAAIATVASGASVVGAGLLRRVVTASSDEAGRSRALSQLTEREQAVLMLIAEGLPTREVAIQLCYSERTVKNVLHDVVTKLGVRSRTQAVVEAVRAGLI
jgi:DNA-binding NarL/FixJ family response regulator